MTHSFRPAGVRDLSLVCRLEARYMADVEPSHRAGWLDAVDRNLQLWIDCLDRTTVLEVAGSAVGYLMWTVQDGAALLVSVNLAPEHRGQGLGQALLARFESEAAGLPLTLGVHRDNPARRLYEKAGWRHVRDDGDYAYFEK